MLVMSFFFFFSSRRRHTRWPRDWSSDVCSSDLIYTVGRRITSMMVAQDAQKGRRVLDRFGPSGGGNTLRPVCGYIILVLGCALGLQEAMVDVGCVLMHDCGCVLGVPLPL